MKAIRLIMVFVLVLVSTFIIAPTAIAQTALNSGPDLSNAEEVIDALLGEWAYVGSTSGLDRTVSFMPNSVAFWNTNKNSKGWENYASSWQTFTYDANRQAIIFLDDWTMVVWEIQEWDSMDELTFLRWDSDNGYAEDSTEANRND